MLRRPGLVSLASAVVLATACGHAMSSSPAVLGACAASSFPIAGVCLSLEEARAFCGKGSQPEGGGCMPLACTEGEPIDLASGECVPVLSLRRLEGGGRRSVDLDAGLGCVNADAGLVVEGDNLACLPHAASCGRGARWKDGACRPDPICPLGTIADPVGACVSVVHKDHGETIVDVGAWIRTVIGPDGGEGTRAICGPLSERPWRAGVISHGNAVIDVQVDMVFPDNEVKAAHVAVLARRHFDAHNVEASSAVPAGRYMEPLWNALRTLGGLSSAASATVHVHCALDGGGDVAGAPHPEKEDSGRAHAGKATMREFTW